MYKGTEKSIERLKKELAEMKCPELINDNPTTAPSKRIIKAIEGNNNNYSYDKPKAGVYGSKSWNR